MVNAVLLEPKHGLRVQMFRAAFDLASFKIVNDIFGGIYSISKQVTIINHLRS